MTNWEYITVPLAAQATSEPTQATTLNTYGKQGWEAVGLATLAPGDTTVLLKREIAKTRASGGRM